MRQRFTRVRHLNSSLVFFLATMLVSDVRRWFVWIVSMLARHPRPSIHICTFCTLYFEKQRVPVHFLLENLVYQCILFQILISNAVEDIQALQFYPDSFWFEQASWSGSRDKASLPPRGGRRFPDIQFDFDRCSSVSSVSSLAPFLSSLLFFSSFSIFSSLSAHSSSCNVRSIVVLFYRFCYDLVGHWFCTVSTKRSPVFCKTKNE